MLTLQGRPFLGPSFCDRLTRRNFLKIGTLGIGGLTLPQLLRAEASAGVRSFDQVGDHDLPGRRAAASGHVRSEANWHPKKLPARGGRSRPTCTGIEICEAFPRLAKMADKLAVVRSLVGNQADHDAIQVFNGHHPGKADSVGRLAAVRLSRRQAARPGRSARRRRLSASVTPARTALQRTGPRVSWARLIRRFARWGRRGEDMVLHGVTLERLAERRTLMRKLRPVPP